MRPYRKVDFDRVRDFLVDTYAYFQRPYNWTIERWNFSISVARVMHDISLEEWASHIAIWEDDQGILGVVNWEAEASGEAFFQLAHENVPQDVLQEMFAFCEARLGIEKAGQRVVYLRIPCGDQRLEQLAASRNYTRLPNSEPHSELDLVDAFPVELSQGFCFEYGDQVTSLEKGTAHAKAFGYFDEELYRQRSPVAFEAMTQTPDYRPELDVCVRAPNNEIAVFATGWYDQHNRIGMLEPLGTVPQYRGLGLARAGVYHLANRIRSEGGTTLQVGSDLEFYRRTGFVPMEKYGIWTRQI